MKLDKRQNKTDQIGWKTIYDEKLVPFLGYKLKKKTRLREYTHKKKCFF